MEQWNIGCSKEIIYLKLESEDQFSHLSNIAIYQTHFSNIPVFHHSIWGKAPSLSSSAYGQVAIKNQSPDVKAKPCLFFSVIDAGCVEGWRNRQGKQALLHYK